jgi:hypothetical protein
MSAKLHVVAGVDPSSRTRTVSGTGVKASVAVSPGLLSFGRVAVGATSVTKAIVVTNTGTSILPIAQVFLSGPNPEQFVQKNDCLLGYVPTGGSCTVWVVFKPRSIDEKTANLVVRPFPSSRAPTQWIGLTGSGT